jgi:hypothetical protein
LNAPAKVNAQVVQIGWDELAKVNSPQPGLKELPAPTQEVKVEVVESAPNIIAVDDAVESKIRALEQSQEKTSNGEAHK